MIIPIRCWSCGRPVAHLWKAYEERINNGEDKNKVLNDLGLKKYCCRSMLMSNVEVIKLASKFKKN